MKFSTMTNHEIILTLCSRIRKERIFCQLTQQELAERSGLGIATIRRAESGKGINLETLISIMRALGRIDNLDIILFSAGLKKCGEKKPEIKNEEKDSLSDKTAVLELYENVVIW
ncbi:helix-turn-helix transcriptional regulator [Salmonella enterica]